MSKHTNQTELHSHKQRGTWSLAKQGCEVACYICNPASGLTQGVHTLSAPTSRTFRYLFCDPYILMPAAGHKHAFQSFCSACCCDSGSLLGAGGRQDAKHVVV
eukprot:1675557-Amphidinium_carterae.2